MLVKSDGWLESINSVGISSNTLQIDQSPDPEAGTAYTASNQSDPRDKISNLQATLNTLSDLKKGADGVRDLGNSVQQGINSIRGLFGR